MAQLNPKLTTYQKIVANYIAELGTQYSQAKGSSLEYEQICDLVNNHFQLVQLGWVNGDFFYQTLIHIDTKPDGKIWIQQNNTEISIGAELIKQGIEASDLVIGFRPAALRDLIHFNA